MTPRPDDVVDLEEVIAQRRLEQDAERASRPEPEEARRGREPEPKVFGRSRR